MRMAGYARHGPRPYALLELPSAAVITPAKHVRQKRWVHDSTTGSLSSA